MIKYSKKYKVIFALYSVSFLRVISQVSMQMQLKFSWRHTIPWKYKAEELVVLLQYIFFTSLNTVSIFPCYLFFFILIILRKL